MAIRDEKLHWKPEALKASGTAEDMLKPMLDNMLEDGLNFEDFFYIISDAAQMVILQHSRLDITKQNKESKTT